MLTKDNSIDYKSVHHDFLFMSEHPDKEAGKSSPLGSSFAIMNQEPRHRKNHTITDNPNGKLSSKRMIIP